MNDQALLDALPVQRIQPVLYLPLWLGGLRDVSGDENHSTPTNMYWHQRGAVDAAKPNDASGRLSVAHAASLGLSPAFSICLYSPEGLVQSGEQWVMVKGAQIAYRLRTGRFRLNVNGVDSDSIGTYAGAKSAIVTLESGNAPDFYTDGNHFGVGLAALTSVSDAGGMNLLGFSSALGFKSSVSAYIVYPGKLTAAEALATHEYLDDVGTPRKQWPGGGIVLPGREVQLVANGDFEEWTGSLPYQDPVGFTVTSPDTAENHIGQSPEGSLHVVSAGALVRAITASVFEIGRPYRYRVVVNEFDNGVGALAGGGNYVTWIAAGVYTGLFIADAASAQIKRGLACDFSVSEFSIWSQPPGYAPHASDPLYLDNIQTARVSLADETSGQLSNTGWLIVSGTWRMVEDATTGARSISCISGGTLRRNLPGSDAMTTRIFTGTGSAALVKGVVELQITATAGDTISAVQLEAA